MNMVTSEYKGQYILKMIDVCELTLKVYRELIDGKDNNMEFNLSLIDCLFDYVNLFMESKESIIKQVKSDPIVTNVNPDEIEKTIDEFCNLLNQVVHKSMVFHFFSGGFIK